MQENIFFLDRFVFMDVKCYFDTFAFKEFQNAFRLV